MSENNLNPGRELGWEDVIQNDNSGGGLLPEGDYSFVVTAVERQRHGGSAKLPPCNKAVVTLSLADEAGNAGQMRHNLFLHSKCEGLLCAFFLAIGLRQHGEPLRMRWDIIGRRGRCQVKQRSYTGNDGIERKTNDIERFLEPGRATREAGGGPLATPAAAPAGQAASMAGSVPAAPAATQTSPYTFPAFPAGTPAAQAAYPQPVQPAAEQTAMPLPRSNPWRTEG